MNNLIDIQTQIQKLQKQASEIKSREFDSTVREILAKMDAFGISIKDLQTFSGSRKGRGRPAGKNQAEPKVKVARVKVKKPTGAVAPKYRGPNGETWSGRGLTPRWMAALIAQGQPKEAFAIPT